MKKLSLLCLGLLFSTMAFAQIEKGNVQLGGSLLWNSSESNGQESSLFSFTPQAGLFLSNTTSLGLILGYSTTSRDAFNSGSGAMVKAKTNQLTFGTYARFHKPVIENLYLFLQPSVALGTGEVDTSPTTAADLNTFNIGLAPGLTYFFSPKFALEMNFGGLNYTSSKLDDQGNETKSDTFGLNMNLASTAIGLSFYIK